MYIFKNLILLIVVFTGLLALRGTEKIPSLVGIERCSVMYWMMLLLSLGVMGCYSYWNLGKLKEWAKQGEVVEMKAIHGAMVREELTISAIDTQA